MAHEESAVWAKVANALCLFKVFSTMKLVVGDSAQPLSPNDWVGIILVSIAL